MPTSDDFVSRAVADKFMDAREIAALLNVPVTWVREHTRNGRIPHIKFGRYVRYDSKDVLAWVEEQKSGGARWRTYVPRPGPRG